MAINTGKHYQARIENPRVGGSIPPQATIRINDLAQLPRLGFVVSELDVGDT